MIYVCGVSPAFDLTLELDSLDDDRVNRVRNERRIAAGKALNAARELTRLGQSCVLFGLAGRESWEEYTNGAASLPNAPEEISLAMTDGAVRENLTLLVGGKTIKINRKGAVCAKEHIAVLKKMLLERMAADEGERIVIFTGSMPEGMTSDDYADLMQAAGDAGARIAVDTAALSREQLLDVSPWLIKPNEHELAHICGLSDPDDEQLLRAARQLADDGIGIVLLTLGSRGLICVTKDETVRVPAEPIKAVNTVGAGDCALAGFVAAAVQGKPVRQCAQQAAHCGSRAAALPD
ncbi:MAG: hypothetical protein E7559_03870 [Ruminococcaceae bacterium]|nr:hypothetical protein [Oscillospiraceae bacterium]